MWLLVSQLCQGLPVAVFVVSAVADEDFAPELGQALHTLGLSP